MLEELQLIYATGHVFAGFFNILEAKGRLITVLVCINLDPPQLLCEIGSLSSFYLIYYMAVL